MSTLRQHGIDYGSPNRSKAEFSTAEKFYNLEESQKHYQELLEENIWLKQHIERNRFQPQNSVSCPYCRSCC